MESPQSPILYQSGPLTIHWHGALLICAIVVSASIAYLEVKRRNEDVRHIADLLVWILIVGIIGARLYHIMSSPFGASRNFNYYFIEQPFSNFTIFGIAIPFPTALFIWEGGVGLFGGILGGILAVILYTRRHHLNTWRWLDITALALLLGQTIGRWGNFFNQELYGTATTLPWGITITNVNQRITPYDDLTVYPLETLFHPVFLYESIWTLIGFIILLIISRQSPRWLRDGDIFAAYLIFYSLGRLFTEALRPDAWVILEVPVAQVVSFIAIVFGLYLIYINRRSSN